MIHPELLHRLCLARDWLRAEAMDEFPVNAIARRAGLSPFHFIRIFRAVFGATPHQYRSHARVDRARKLLLLTDRSVTDVCMTVGFSSLGSFSTLFTRRVGVTPSGFRRRYRTNGRLNKLPSELTPGCFSLMGQIPAQSAISKKRPARRLAKLPAA
jgi:AraC-like DNA-binding protein